jgi:hypothetical protein
VSLVWALARNVRRRASIRPAVHLGVYSHPAGERERAEAATEGTEYRYGARRRTSP